MTRGRLSGGILRGGRPGQRDCKRRNKRMLLKMKQPGALEAGVEAADTGALLVGATADGRREALCRAGCETRMVVRSVLALQQPADKEKGIS